MWHTSHISCFKIQPLVEVVTVTAATTGRQIQMPNNSAGKTTLLGHNRLNPPGDASGQMYSVGAAGVTQLPMFRANKKNKRQKIDVCVF